MAWRVWSTGAHVRLDSYCVDVERELASGLNKHTRIPHTVDWKTFQDTLTHRKIKIPPSLVQAIRESSQSNTKQYCHRSGRAEILRTNINRTYRKPSGLHKLPTSVIVDSDPSSFDDARLATQITCNTTSATSLHPTWSLDKQTLYFKNLPSTVTAEELQSIVESFGNVTNCEVFQNKADSTAYVRMEKESACNWVISCFQGIPYDDTSGPVDCGFAIDLSH